jgi:hypothetical protein
MIVSTYIKKTMVIMVVPFDAGVFRGVLHFIAIMITGHFQMSHK